MIYNETWPNISIFIRKLRETSENSGLEHKLFLTRILTIAEMENVKSEDVGKVYELSPCPTNQHSWSSFFSTISISGSYITREPYARTVALKSKSGVKYTHFGKTGMV